MQAKARSSACQARLCFGSTLTPSSSLHTLKSPYFPHKHASIRSSSATFSPFLSACFFSSSPILHDGAVPSLRTAKKEKPIANGVPTTEYYRSLGNDLKQKADDEKLKAALEQRAARRTKSIMLSDLATSAKRGDYPRVQKLFEELRNKGTKPDNYIFDQLLIASARHGNVKQAFKTYNDMKKAAVKPSVYTFNILFNAIANSKVSADAYVDRLLWLKDSEMPRFSVRPNVETYNVLMKAFITHGHEDSQAQAWELLKEMKKNKLNPDIATYTFWMQTIGGLVGKPSEEAPAMAKVFAVWQDMKNAKIEPDLQSFNTLLQICCNAKTEERDMGFEVYKDMIRAGITPNLHTFNILLMLCWKQKNVKYARDIFDTIIELNKKRGNRLVIDTPLCHAVLRVCGMGKSQEDMRELITAVLRVMKANRIEKNTQTYETLITAYSKAGNLELAQRTFQDLVDKKGKVGIKAYTALLFASKIAKDGQAAYDTFLRLTEANVEPDDVFIKMLNDVLVSTGRNDLRREVYQYFTEQETGKKEKKQERGKESESGEDGENQMEEQDEGRELESGDEENEHDPLVRTYALDRQLEKERMARQKEKKKTLKESKQKREKIKRLKKEGYKGKWVRTESGEWVEEFPLEEIEKAEQEQKEKHEMLAQAIEKKRNKKRTAVKRQRAEQVQQKKDKPAKRDFNPAGFMKAKVITTRQTQEW